MAIKWDTSAYDALNEEQLLELHTKLMLEYEEYCNNGNLYEAYHKEITICKLEDYLEENY